MIPVPIFALSLLFAFFLGATVFCIINDKTVDGVVYYNLEAEHPRGLLEFEVSYKFIQDINYRKTMNLKVKRKKTS